MNATLTALLLTAGLISQASAATVAKTYSYFSISGSTLDAIQKQLDERGPKVTGHRYPGATQMAFLNRIGYRTSTNGCSVASASVTVKARIILPYWRRPRAASPEVRLVWDTLSADIKRHEESHVIIAKNHARLLEQRLLDIPRQRDCEAALDKAIGVTERVLAKHSRAQAEFDRIEGINFSGRMMRLLHYRLERLANRQRPG
jgi:predicted secreted Zn-dependent protease